MKIIGNKGVTMKNFTTLMFLIFTYNLLFAQNTPQPPKFIPYKEVDKWGYCNRDKKILIKPQFDEVELFDPITGIAEVKINYKNYKIDTTGKILEGIFSQCSNFSEGLAIASSNGKYGFINNKGNFVIEPIFQQCELFSQGLAAVKINNKWGFIDKNGQFFINPIYDSVLSFSGGFAPYKLGKTIGLLNLEAKTIYTYKLTSNDIEASQILYESLYNFFLHTFLPYNEKCAIFKLNTNKIIGFEDQTHKFIIINKKGKIIIDISAMSIMSRADGFYIMNQSYIKDILGNIMDNTKKIHYLSFLYNLETDFYFFSKHSLATTFKNDLAIFEKNSKFGFINKNDKIVIPAIFDDCKQFSENYAAIKLNNFWGYCNKQGKIAIKPKFVKAFNFIDDIALVQIEQTEEMYQNTLQGILPGKYFQVIDKKGNIIQRPKQVIFINDYYRNDQNSFNDYYYYLSNDKFYIINSSLIPKHKFNKDLLKNVENILKNYKILIYEKDFGIYYNELETEDTFYENNIRLGLFNNNFEFLTPCKYLNIESYLSLAIIGDMHDEFERIFYPRNVKEYRNRGILLVEDENNTRYYIDFFGKEYK